MRPNVAKQDLIILCDLAGQQKNHRAEKVWKRFLKLTHDIKLAGNLSTITGKLEEINDTSKILGELFKKSDCVKETPKLAIENTQNDFRPGVIYDISLANTLSIMKKEIIS